jgi:hypothetical protein
MQLTYRGRTPLYGKTLQGVLGHRPCRVLVAADPTSGADTAATMTPKAAVPG